MSSNKAKSKQTTKATSTTTTINTMQQLAVKAGAIDKQQHALLAECKLSAHTQAVLYNAVIAASGKSKLTFQTTVNTHCNILMKRGTLEVKAQVINKQGKTIFSFSKP